MFQAQPMGRFACRCGIRFDGAMAPRFLTILTGRNYRRSSGSRESRRRSTKRRLRTLRALLSRRESWSAGTALQDTRQPDELTRRRSADHRHNCWHIYYGDVRVGTIAERIGNPHDTDPWEWNRGFYPGSHPREHQSDTAPTFEQARAEFECASQVLLSNRTEADFQAWRDDRDWTARKYALWDAGKRLDPPSYGPGKPCSRFIKCPAARYSTCTAPSRYWCTCLTSRRPNALHA
jgi:hypothetical protein